jgi:hypothetical protein
MKMKLNSGRRLSEHHFNLQNLKVLKVVTNQLYKNRKKKLMNNKFMAILYLHFSNFWTNIFFWIKASEVFSIFGKYFQVSIKSLYLGLKMIALLSKYITEQ